MAQDGSDIRYYESNNLDSTLIGKYCHIDFGELSSRGRVIDTLEINVIGQTMKFYEHREDDGFNNWFNKQYLIRVDTNNLLSTRLQNSKIDSLSANKIYVTSTLGYYVNESPIDTITVFQHWYDRVNISKVLIKE
ncbi:MAG: hypothetical protein COA32_11390 [Fluviicola sp.]|nr:MAG: hypothetical protein COA32_11390 [Fluviicola sp.]